MLFKVIMYCFVIAFSPIVMADAQLKTEDAIDSLSSTLVIVFSLVGVLYLALIWIQKKRQGKPFSFDLLAKAKFDHESPHFISAKRLSPKTLIITFSYKNKEYIIAEHANGVTLIDDMPMEPHKDMNDERP
ncbi:MAG: hypothetical protein AAGB12_04260 [Pseudomonadota bacterium]